MTTTSGSCALGWVVCTWVCRVHLDVSCALRCVVCTWMCAGRSMARLSGGWKEGGVDEVSSSLHCMGWRLWTHTMIV